MLRPEGIVKEFLNRKLGISKYVIINHVNSMNFFIVQTMLSFLIKRSSQEASSILEIRLRRTPQNVIILVVKLIYKLSIKEDLILRIFIIFKRDLHFHPY
jgi:hypothetical protein